MQQAPGLSGFVGYWGLNRLSASESALMDPQGRILLEQTNLALADAGGRLGAAVGAQTGVYVGVMHMEYIQYMTGAQQNVSSPHASCPRHACHAILSSTSMQASHSLQKTVCSRDAIPQLICDRG
jgi:hypothetical protein